MSFYSTIYNNYDHIFMLNNNQIDFIKHEIDTPKGILEIGCATGKLANELALHGYNIDAFDLDAKMISLASNKFNHPNLTFRKGNMLDMLSMYQPASFGGIVCFGNTIVHLLELQQIQKLFNDTHSLLKPESKFLIQILNYQYILDKKISSLPIIENEHVKFIREYGFKTNGLINFKTQLTEKSSNRIVNNEIELLPVTKTKIEKLLIQAGFKNISFFGNFAYAPLQNNSLPLVVKAEKE